ncbi:MAG: hypothetical protein ACRDPR_04790 [Nocardioidaceae bacterium]
MTSIGPSHPLRTPIPDPSPEDPGRGPTDDDPGDDGGSGETSDPVEHWTDDGSSWWAPHPVPPSHRVRVSLEFEKDGDGYVGRSTGGRNWRISEELTGWRLEFQDDGDRIATYAGTHRSIDRAIEEARR